MDRGAWRATVHGVSKSWTQLSSYHALKARKTINYVKKTDLLLDVFNSHTHNQRGTRKHLEVMDMFITLTMYTYLYP